MKKVEAKKVTLSAATMLQLIDELQTRMLNIERANAGVEGDSHIYRNVVWRKLELGVMERVLGRILKYHSEIVGSRGRLSTVKVPFTEIEVEVLLINIKNAEVKMLMQPLASDEYLNHA